MPEIKRILMPLIFSEHDTYAADYARQIALCAGAEVDLVHVTPEVDFIYGHEAALQSLHKDFKGYEKEVADKLMTAFAEKSLAGVAIGKKIVLQGNPSDEIIHYALHNDIQNDRYCHPLPQGSGSPDRRFCCRAGHQRLQHPCTGRSSTLPDCRLKSAHPSRPATNRPINRSGHVFSA
jgi:universal stress protein A